MKRNDMDLPVLSVTHISRIQITNVSHMWWFIGLKIF